MNRTASYVPLVVILMAACGGDDGEVPSDILPASRYEAQCEHPRSGKDINGASFPDEDGSLLDEQLWLRSWIDDTYLWYKEVPRANPKMFSTATDYFDILKTGVFTTSGKPKDQFHFTYVTSDWVALSQGGVEASYGLTWALIKSTPPRQVVVAYVEPGSPAAAANIARGAVAQTVDGVDVANGDGAAAVDTLNAGLFPNEVGKSHTLVLLDQGSTTPRTVMLTSESLTSTPVRTIALTGENAHVGYLLFNDHIATAEKGLVDAVTALKTANIDELVLDLRYNGGGYLAIAAELAYMIAGPTSSGVTFDQLQFNDKHPTQDPVTGASLAPEPFLGMAQGFSVTKGTALPTLNLPNKRVFVLTGPGTCSASEAVMNGLAGAGIEVIQIGTTTCGKPYGFYPTDNCGTTYFAIQFQGINAKGFGDYADGFVPGGVNKGCVVADDFTHQLGDPTEGRLAKALAYIKNPNACTVTARSSADPLAAIDGVVRKPLWLQNAILRK